MLSSGLKYSPVPAYGIGKNAPLAYGETKRLLTIYVLARPDRSKPYRHMPVIGSSYNDRVDIGARDQLSKVTVAPTTPESAGPASGRIVLLNGLPSRLPSQVFALIAVTVGVRAVLGSTRCNNVTNSHDLGILFVQEPPQIAHSHTA
jgi:hypothetical protein